MNQQEEIAKRLNHIPRKYKKAYLKAMNSRSRKAAIRAFCLECCYYQEKEVRECTDKGCSLYKYRETG